MKRKDLNGVNSGGGSDEEENKKDEWVRWTQELKDRESLGFARLVTQLGLEWNAPKTCTRLPPAILFQRRKKFVHIVNVVAGIFRCLVVAPAEDEKPKMTLEEKSTVCGWIVEHGERGSQIGETGNQFACCCCFCLVLRLLASRIVILAQKEVLEIKDREKEKEGEGKEGKEGKEKEKEERNKKQDDEDKPKMDKEMDKEITVKKEMKQKRKGSKGDKQRKGRKRRSFWEAELLFPRPFWPSAGARKLGSNDQFLDNQEPWGFCDALWWSEKYFSSQRVFSMAMKSQQVDEDDFRELILQEIIHGFAPGFWPCLVTSTQRRMAELTKVCALDLALLSIDLK